MGATTPPSPSRSSSSTTADLALNCISCAMYSCVPRYCSCMKKQKASFVSLPACVCLSIAFGYFFSVLVQRKYYNNGFLCFCFCFLNFLCEYVGWVERWREN